MLSIVNKITIVSIMFLILLLGAGISEVFAADLNLDPNENDPNCATEALRKRNPDKCINLQPIQFPVFLSLVFIESFTVFSYITLGFNVSFLGLTLLWIFLVGRAAIGYLRSQGETVEMENANKRLQSILGSISILFFSTLGLILLGTFLGLGNFFSWPKKFSQCKDGTLYLTKALELESLNKSGTRLTDEQIDAQCF